MKVEERSALLKSIGESKTGLSALKYGMVMAAEAIGKIRRGQKVPDAELALYESGFARTPESQAYRLGMKPHLYSRVIAVASSYDLAMQDSLPDEALRKVVAQARGGSLDEDVVSLLSEVVGVYPVGSTVRLSDGNLGVVSNAHVLADSGLAQKASVLPKAWRWMRTTRSMWRKISRADA